MLAAMVHNGDWMRLPGSLLEVCFIIWLLS
jgi:hypothetical protein